MEHSSRKKKTNKKKPNNNNNNKKKQTKNLLFLNLFILTAHGSEGPEQLHSSYVRGGPSGSQQSRPNSVGFMKRRSVQETTWGLGKGSHKQLHSTMKVRQMVIQHLLSVSLGFPVCRVGQHIPHQRPGVNLTLGKMHQEPGTSLGSLNTRVLPASGCPCEERPCLPGRAAVEAPPLLCSQNETKLETKA